MSDGTHLGALPASFPTRSPSPSRDDGSFSIANFEERPYNSWYGSELFFLHSEVSALRCNGLFKGGSSVAGLDVGDGSRFCKREMRRRGINPGREAVPPVMRRLEIIIGRRSIGS
jgi:hypothetical protein